MKTILKTIILFLISSLSIKAQSLVGKWQVVSYEDEIAFYNKPKDSISFKINYETEKEKLGFKELVDELIFSRTFEIDENYFLMQAPVIGDLKSKYQIDYKNGIIILIPEETEKLTDQWSFKFAGDNYIKITIPTEGGEIILGLKKI